ncbi:MAG: hypothetical protein GYB66_02270 [Chloroflexi bacterium]|nr:hypothetical protein [Chloroflexota bacterium]
MSQRNILFFWFPLAFSWLLMTIAGPWIQAVISRQADAQTQLAAFGIVMSLSVTIEAPVIMLLGTSTALARDRQSYSILWRYMMLVNLFVTIVAAGFAFTPLFDLWLDGVLGIPEKIREAARPGMAIMLLWSALIGYRRFYQGILIRTEHTGVVGQGTILRIVVSMVVAVLLGVFSGWSGVAIGAMAMILAVGVEAVYAFWMSRGPVADVQQQARPPNVKPLSYRTAFKFHLPLALTSLLILLVRPMIEWGLARTDDAEAALAAWPVAYGILLITRAGGMAYQEVVIALGKGPQQTRALQQFAWGMGGSISLFLVVVAWTPLIDVYLGPILGAPQDLHPMVVNGARVAGLIPLLTTLHSYFRGLLMLADTTPPIYLAMFLNLIVTGGALLLALEMALPPLVSATVALTVGMLAEVAILWGRYLANRYKLADVWRRETASAPVMGD